MKIFSSKKSRSRVSRRKHRRVRLFEQLEDRRLLATLTVNTSEDVVDASDGFVSLREAISAANASVEDDVIEFATSLNGQTIALTLTGTAENQNVSGDLDFGTGVVILRGNGPNNTIISAGSDTGIGERVIDLVDRAEVTIEGVTIRGGRGTIGGGIAARPTPAGSLDLIDVVLTDNEATQTGGGLVVADTATVTINNSTISGNTASLGGGIDSSGNLTIERTTIDDNTANGAGGGIRIAAASILNVASSTISNNNAYDGGAISNTSSTATIQNTTISGNTATRFGGAIDSLAFGSGAAAKTTVVQSTITGNTSPGSGNINTYTGGGATSSEVELSGTIIVGNSGAGTFDNITFNTGGGSPAVVTSLGNNLFDDGAFGIQIASDQINVTAAVIDPTLADNGGPTLTHALVRGGPAIDAGGTTTLLTDQRGFLRVLDGDGDGTATADIGATEALVFPDELIVDTADDNLDGDFSDGQFSLREALLVANQRTGSDDISFSSDVTDPIVLQLGQLEITDSVTITGLGQETTVIDANQQSRVMNIQGDSIDVTLSGLTLTGGITTGENRFVDGALQTTHSGGGIRFESDGALTLTDSTLSGNSTSGDGAYGGGISTSTGSVTLTGSTLSDNSTSGAYAYGGGISTSTGSVTLMGSMLSGNSTSGDSADGGGIQTRYGALTLTGSTVSGNSTSGDGAYGGGIFTNGGSVTLTGSTLSGNSTSGEDADGGGIRTYSGSVTLTGSTLSGNSTTGERAYGGGIFTSTGSVTLTGSTLSGNSTTGENADGGGLWFDNSTVTIVNSTITGNTASRAGGGLRMFADLFDEKITIHNSIIAGNTAPTNPDFTAPTSPETNLEVRSSLIGVAEGTTLTDSATADANGNFVGIDWTTVLASHTVDDVVVPLLTDNGGPTQTIALLPGSPAIDAGNNALAVDSGGNALTTDQRGDGFPRIVGGTVDVGAFESSAESPRDLLVQVASNGTDIVVTDGGTEVSRFTAPFDDLAVVGGNLDDTITIADLNSLILDGLPIAISGGGGNDRLVLQGSGQAIDATTHSLTGIEVIDLRGSGDNSLTLREDQVASLPDAGQTLRVIKDPTDDVTFTTGDFALTGSTTQDDGVVIEVASESSTIQFLGTQFTNPIEPADVNGINGVTASDAITVINQLNDPTAELFSGPSRFIATEQLTVPFPLFFFDVNGDGNLSASDVLRIINILNAPDGDAEPIAASEPTEVVAGAELSLSSSEQEEPLELETLGDLAPQSKWVNPSVDDASVATRAEIQIRSNAESSESESAVDALLSESSLSERAMEDWFTELGRR